MELKLEGLNKMRKKVGGDEEDELKSEKGIESYILKWEWKGIEVCMKEVWEDVLS